MQYGGKTNWMGSLIPLIFYFHLPLLPNPKSYHYNGQNNDLEANRSILIEIYIY